MGMHMEVYNGRNKMRWMFCATPVGRAKVPQFKCARTTFANNGKFSNMILKQLDLTMEIIVMIVKGIIIVAENRKKNVQGNSMELQARRCRSIWN